MIFFHGPDQCADFPHRVIIPLTIRRIGGRTVPILGDATFIICSHCDHWINRPGGTCGCREHCHEQKSGRNVTKPGRPKSAKPGGTMLDCAGKHNQI